MEKYKIEQFLGKGTFGTVVRAIDEDNQMVAIKKLQRKIKSWDQVLNSKEIQALISLNHKNIIKLLKVIRKDEDLYLIFQFWNQNLYELYHSIENKIYEDQIKILLQQLLQGIDYIHKKGFIHQDLKPENILVKKNLELKIIDFGSTILKENGIKNSREYLGTIWYRSPEKLLNMKEYDEFVDIWSIGSIMAELYLKRPLFTGKDEKEQLLHIFSILGTPEENGWKEGQERCKELDFIFPTFLNASIDTIIKDISKEGVDLLSKLISVNPSKRISSECALLHSYFQ
eukprot:gene1561-12686_t